jgi:hypothetical protein
MNKRKARKELVRHTRERDIIEMDFLLPLSKRPKERIPKVVVDLPDRRLPTPRMYDAWYVDEAMRRLKNNSEFIEKQKKRNKEIKEALKTWDFTNVWDSEES